VDVLLLPLLLHQLPLMCPRALANSTWALARLGYTPPPQQLAQVRVA
jgi:hypothetical protein